MRTTQGMLNGPRQQVAPLGGVLRADITTRLFANRLTARWRLLTIERSGASSSRFLAARRRLGRSRHARSSRRYHYIAHCLVRTRTLCAFLQDLNENGYV